MTQSHILSAFHSTLQAASKPAADIFTRINKIPKIVENFSQNYLQVSEFILHTHTHTHTQARQFYTLKYNAHARKIKKNFRNLYTPCNIFLENAAIFLLTITELKFLRHG